MPFSPTPHSNGDVMSWADIQANATDARAWVNDIPNADIDDGSIRREHLVRPVLLGYPVEGSHSTVQEAHTATKGVQGTGMDLVRNAPWGALKERYILIPKMNDGGSQLIRTPLGRTLQLFRASYVEVHAFFACMSKADGTAASYPDGAGGPANAVRGGYFALHVYDRASKTDDEFTAGLQHVYTPDPTAEERWDKFIVSYVGNLDEGVYDFQLVYHLSGGPDDELFQLNLTRATLTVEVL